MRASFPLLAPTEEVTLAGKKSYINWMRNVYVHSLQPRSCAPSPVPILAFSETQAL